MLKIKGWLISCYVVLHVFGSCNCSYVSATTIYIHTSACFLILHLMKQVCFHLSTHDSSHFTSSTRYMIVIWAVSSVKMLQIARHRCGWNDPVTLRIAAAAVVLFLSAQPGLTRCLSQQWQRSFGRDGELNVYQCVCVWKIAESQKPQTHKWS